MKKTSPASWLEVSLTVSGELAEAVADVLVRFAPEGVTTEQAVTYNDEEDEGTPFGLVTVRAYLKADEQLEDRRQKLEEALYYLGTIQRLPAPIYTPIADQNWMEAWKERYRPIPIGRKLIIVPAWLESPDDRRLPIRIDPGMAFGTGTHPTTQLCLELLEDTFGDLPSSPSQRPSSKSHRYPVIDVGCGSGILSIAALKLGADFALGVDIDEAAIRASRENAEANGVTEEDFHLGIGSVGEIRNSLFKIRQAKLVLANILAPVILRLLEEGLAEIVEPRGQLILSGILKEQSAGVITAAEAHGFQMKKNLLEGDWVAAAFRKKAAS